MTIPATQSVTQMLLAWRAGDEAARDALIPMVYDQLHRMARQHLRRERSGHTLQTTALINEAYLKLAEQPISWQSRNHFFGIAARLMRQILVDHARARQSFKESSTIAVGMFSQRCGRWRISAWHEPTFCKVTWPRRAKLTRISSFYGRRRMLTCRS